MNSLEIIKKTEELLLTNYLIEIKDATTPQLHECLAKAVMMSIAPIWRSSRLRHERERRAYYFSAEYLMGRAVFNNLNSLGITDEVKQLLSERGADINDLEEIEDVALGNGGLGRLAACFLDSAATHDLPLDGYGLRYRYGLFKQELENGFQKEEADTWLKYGDSWSKRRDDRTVIVEFADRACMAVPYDIPIIGYHTDNIGLLRVWQSEALEEFNFALFNEHNYSSAVNEKNSVEDITRVLYPNDSSYEGKKLRLKQQYFLASAGMQDILRRFLRVHGKENLGRFAEFCAVQLNDTHPTVAIPETVRLLMREGLSFEASFEIVQNTFSYTNHTIMSEALEAWDISLFREVIPAVYDIICRINDNLNAVLHERNVTGEKAASMQIIKDGRIHMALLATFVSSHVNGVAKIHTDILRRRVLADWNALFPEKFLNKTNGVTPRRFLKLCNPELTSLLAEKLGGEDFLLNSELLGEMKQHLDDETVMRFSAIKLEKKKQLAAVIERSEGIFLPPYFMFDVQVKRLHEYKRQLMNALSLMDIYYGIKDGTMKDFTPTAFIFGAKAAPGYARAKGIIKYINEVARIINSDPAMRELMRVVFVHNYNCSYAEHIIPAADVSEQISPAGTEASGTGNMKLMMNGAVTLGTYDGANIEIVEQAGIENNYIFGARVEELESIGSSYNPRGIYENDFRVRRALDTLVNGTTSDCNTGIFSELHNAILNGAHWHRPDHYFVLKDFSPYVAAKLKVNADYRNTLEFSRKCLINTASSGVFSSDRTVKEYAREIWNIQSSVR